MGEGGEGTAVVGSGKRNEEMRRAGYEKYVAAMILDLCVRDKSSKPPSLAPLYFYRTSIRTSSSSQSHQEQ
eukprot:scaffold3016_cov146-Skeletonema_menzelii.AAC.3